GSIQRARTDSGSPNLALSIQATIALPLGAKSTWGPSALVVPSVMSMTGPSEPSGLIRRTLGVTSLIPPSVQATSASPERLIAMSERSLFPPCSGPVTGISVELKPACASTGSISARTVTVARTRVALRTAVTPGRCYAFGPSFTPLSPLGHVRATSSPALGLSFAPSPTFDERISMRRALLVFAALAVAMLSLAAVALAAGQNNQGQN